MKIFKSLTFIFVFVILAGCGSGLSGVYSSVKPVEYRGVISVEFTSGKNAFLIVNGIKSDVTYSVDGKDIKVTTGNGTNEIWKIEDDGEITISSSKIFGTIVLQKEKK